uniref:Uncharacterized protein LOC100175270 n=1 Tax=Phallusia mammillata TaxID=59560 RepID=A0A6F9DG94_9ASCI|nr:uncharacterized protein LOC100175270 [Phallusia mammillata]
MLWLHIAGLILVAAQHGSCLTYRATIDMIGVKGHVTFVPDGGNMNITAAIDNSENYTYSIMLFPAIFGQQQSSQVVCSQLGSIILTWHGVANGTTVVVPNLPENSVFNRGLLISNGACATILAVGDTILTYRAKFIGPISGEVWIRKRNSLSGLAVYTDLAYATNKTNPTGITAVDVVQFASGSSSSATSTQCDGLSNRTILLVNIPVGNSVSSTDKRSAVFVENLNSVFSFMGIEVSGSLLVCTGVQNIQAKTVKAKISWDGVRGEISMTQVSPFDSTTTSVQLSGLNPSYLPATYHVHKFPVPQRISSSDDRCSTVNVAGHFDPYGVGVGASNTTGDRFEIGDLSGKYGTISTANYTASFVDWNLPLFGSNSVVGRSIVIHRADTTRWVCGNIGNPTETTTTAVVNFKSPAYGTMYLRQPSGQPDADTSVYVELANMDGVKTTSHNHHVHVYPVGEDCASAGPHYNPSSVFTDGSYSTECSSSNPLRCELGDLSGKLSQIDISSTLVNSNDAKFFFTDSNLPLSGPHNVIGRSIVVHVAGGGAPRYACANITELRKLRLKTDSTWKGDNTNGRVMGELFITQDTEFDYASVQGTISGLASISQSYGIYELPIQTSAIGTAQCTTVGVLHNPYDVFIVGASGQTFDKFPVGDLSGKYSDLSGQNVVTLDKQDNNLPLAEAVGIAGRSIIIQQVAPGSWKCSTLSLAPSGNTGYVISAQVLFTDVFVGYATLRQVVYEDGSSSPTTIEVALLPPDAVTTSSNHNWHVHIDPIIGEQNCSVALGHYNPYGANVTAATYSNCLPSNPLACEVGDLSKKHAQYTVQPSNGRKLFVDTDLPLHTDKTVFGRSLVFHVANGGAARLTCANILPTSNVYTLQYSSDVTYDYYRFTDAVAKSLSISRLRVIVLHNTAVPVTGNGCAAVMVYIAGSVTEAKIAALLAGTAQGLSPYTPTTSCVSTLGATVVGKSEFSGAPGLGMTIWAALIGPSIAYLMQHI